MSFFESSFSVAHLKCQLYCFVHAAYLNGQTTSCVQPIPRDSLGVECTDNTMLQAATFYEGFKVIKV